VNERVEICRVKVSEVCPLSFDGSHAMLIRTHDGDYAICTVSWLNSSSTFGGNAWPSSSSCVFSIALLSFISAGPDLAGGGPGAQLTWGH